MLGFFAAAAIAPAISGSIATVGFVLFYSSNAPLLTTWLNWFASDALGIIMVAPLLIGLGSIRHEFPHNWELAAGTSTLAALVMGTAIALGSPEQYWHTALPFGMLLPALLAAYCRPVFAAAAALILSFGVVWATTFEVGDFGGPTDLHDRVYAARAMLLAISAGTLLLAALFAERRKREAVLAETNEQLKETNGRLQESERCAARPAGGAAGRDLRDGRGWAHHLLQRRCGRPLGRQAQAGRDRWFDLARYYHADGTPMALQDCPTEIALQQGRVVEVERRSSSG